MAASRAENVFRVQGEMLAKAMWDWKICSGCEEKSACFGNRCCAGRLKRIQPFLRYVRAVVDSYGLETTKKSSGALFTHEDLRKLMLELRSRPEAAKEEIVADFFSSNVAAEPASSAKCDRAMRLAGSVLLMMDCSGDHRSTDELECGDLQMSWKADESLADLLSKRLPQGDHPIFANGDIHVVKQACMGLKAKTLASRGRLRFRLTEDMSRHLHLDNKGYAVEIFHCTSFLKEYLLMSKPDTSTCTPKCIIPRQLALEIIDSIQKVLFPFADRRSMKILKRLVAQGGFDPDCLRFESEAIRTPEEQDISFHYFGERLAILLDEVENPRPRGLLEKWLERKSGARYVMLATLMGVVFAILLGIAALAISGYQTWITYQAWKHPVTPS